MSRKKLDIAMILALKEEFRTLFEQIELIPTNKISNEYGQWFEWKIKNVKDIERSIFCSFIGDMGTNNAIQYTTKFLSEYEPNIIISFGLSGSLSNSAKLGDIVVATETDLYDDKGSIKDEEGYPKPNWSGTPIQTPDFKTESNNFEFSFPVIFQRWLETCRKNREDILGKTFEQLPSILKREKTHLHVGPVACGNYVVKSTIWKKELKLRNRKYEAVDMESAGVAFFRLDKNWQSSKILIVRVISDFADERKEELDRFDSKEDKIRKWALMNGIEFIENFLKTDGVPPSEEITKKGLPDTLTDINSNIVQMQLKYLEENTLNIFKKKGPKALLLHQNFFYHFISFSKKSQEAEYQNVFESIIKQVESFPDDAPTIASITGFVGTGKSTILACIYLMQLERFKNNSTSYYPLMINMRRYTDMRKDGTDTIRKVFIEDLNRLIERPELTKVPNIILIIDGCDEYYRHPAQSILDQQLAITVKKLSKTVKVVGLGRGEPSFLKEREYGALDWAEKEEILDLKRFSSEDKENLKAVLLAYSNLHYDGEEAEKFAKELLSIIKQCRITEIDLFILSLITDAIRKGWAKRSSGISALYFNYCKQKIREIYSEMTLNEWECEAKVKEQANNIFDLYVKRKISGVPPEDYSTIHELPHLHASVKEFLIAEHVVDQLLNSSLHEVDLLGYIYPYGINRFIKSIINRNDDTQREVLEAIKSLFDKCTLREKPHLCYILGRFESMAIRGEARKILRDYLQKAKSEEPKCDLMDDVPLEYRQWLLYIRTIYISLVYLDDAQAGNDYIHQMLIKPKWDDLNRGFHLEYYEDLSRAPTQDDIIALDNLEINPIRTFDLLIEKVSADCKMRTNRAMTSIELQTLCSLCIHRHLEGFLEENKRNRLLDLLIRIKNEKTLILPTTLIPFLNLSSDLLSREKVSKGQILSELIALKRIERAGWNAERKISGKIIKRYVPNPESVADHTFGCLIIAALFLPEHCPSDQGQYNKNTILRMLLIHDLGESVIGDKVSFRRTEEDIKKEHDIMKMLTQLGSIECFSAFGTWRKYWDDWKKGGTINARIARDIDQIENLIQIKMYTADPNSIIPDADEWLTGLYDNLQTDLGKKIAEELYNKDEDLITWKIIKKMSPTIIQ